VYQRHQAEQAMNSAYGCGKYRGSAERNFCWRCMRQLVRGEECAKHGAEVLSIGKDAQRAERMKAQAYKNLGQAESGDGNGSESTIRNGVEVGAPPTVHVRWR